jgi:hypothetical protein
MVSFTNAQVVNESFSLSDITLVDKLQPAPARQTKPLKRFINKLNGQTIFGCDPLKFNLRIQFLKTAEKKTVTAFVFQTELREVVFEEFGGVQTGKLHIFGYLINGQGDEKNMFEERFEIHSSAEELADVKVKKTTFVKAVLLSPGIYEITSVERDIISGCRGINTVKFTVPDLVN